MTLTGIIDLWFHPRKWISDSENTAQNSFLATFFITAAIIPFCTLLGDSVVLKFDPKNFFITLLFQFWSLVLYYVIGNLLLTALLHFIGTLIHEKESRTHSARYFYVLMLLSATPAVLLPGLALLARYTGLGAGFYGFLKLVMLIWTFLLQFNVIRTIFNFTSAKSILLYAGAFLCIIGIDILFLYNSIFNLFSRL